MPLSSVTRPRRPSVNHARLLQTGTYFPALRVASQRRHVNTPFARSLNFSRVRVVVNESRDSCRERRQRCTGPPRAGCRRARGCAARRGVTATGRPGCPRRRRQRPSRRRRRRPPAAVRARRRPACSAGHRRRHVGRRRDLLDDRVAGFGHRATTTSASAGSSWSRCCPASPSRSSTAAREPRRPPDDEPSACSAGSSRSRCSRSCSAPGVHRWELLGSSRSPVPASSRPFRCRADAGRRLPIRARVLRSTSRSASPASRSRPSSSPRAPPSSTDAEMAGAVRRARRARGARGRSAARRPARSRRGRGGVR